MARGRRVCLSVVLATVIVVGVTSAGGTASAATHQGERVAEQAYTAQRGLDAHWHDAGWAPRDLDAGTPARLVLVDYGGWILARDVVAGPFGAVEVEFKAPAAFGDFLEIGVAREDAPRSDAVLIDAAHVTQLDDGWLRARVLMAELSPAANTLDSIMLRARHKVDDTPVEIRAVTLLAPAGQTVLQSLVQRAYPSREVTMRVDCIAPTHTIDDRIYGTAFNSSKNRDWQHQWTLNPSMRRWGGNAATRYNWRLGNAWNAGRDWYFKNVNYAGDPNFTWRDFLDESRERGTRVALTLPLIGWVAKDTESHGFPVSLYGPQADTEPGNPAVGNGISKNGDPLYPGSPTQTSRKAPPRFIADWVRDIRERDARRGPRERSVQMYFLDNEPMLWDSTHRDVHPEPTTYEEVLQRTFDYGSLVRKADPQAIIAGPSVWGWSAYFFSALDRAAGYTAQPDRRAHGEVDFLKWYLHSLKQHEDQTGERLIDMLDIHYYPQGRGIYSEQKTDTDTADRRIRSTRALWDRTYVDESWIREPVYLIPRMQSLIAENYPGLGLSIGEYNFGGEDHMSGALALAETLGRFGQQNVQAAFYWNVPPADSPAYYAFRAYRNYDGKRATFLEQSLSTIADTGVSLFASTNAQRTRMVVVALNFDVERAADAQIFLRACGVTTGGRAFYYTGMPEGIIPDDRNVVTDEQSTLEHRLPPYSITVFELAMRAE